MIGQRENLNFFESSCLVIDRWNHGKFLVNNMNLKIKKITYQLKTFIRICTIQGKHKNSYHYNFYLNISYLSFKKKPLKQTFHNASSDISIYKVGHNENL